MDKQVVDLGFILKQFPQFKFSMDSFTDRLRLQKFIYLIQTFDVYLGYDFSWYLRGPYCSTLASCGSALKGVYEKIPDDRGRFTDDRVQERFEKFMRFIHRHENDEHYLEIATSLHYLKNTCTLSDDEIIKKVAAKRKDFSEEGCRQIWRDLKDCHLI